MNDLISSLNLTAETDSAELILACGGKSTRMGENKLLMDIGGKPCILRACEPFDECNNIKRIIVSAPNDMHGVYKTALGTIKKPVVFADSGETRQQSVMNAVKLAKEDIIVIHDGARPLISLNDIVKSVSDAYKYGSSIICTPVKETIRFDDGKNSYSPQRDCLYTVKTPQSFSRRLYLYAAERAQSDFTDDAQLLDSVGIKPHITIGEYTNIKLTTREDIAVANSNYTGNMRIGHGYDVHRLTEGRKLILGGVEIPYEKGLLGHSDADILTHALMDSLLGAAALGDIGKLFPDNNPDYKGADSVELLKNVVKILKARGYSLINTDVTVIAQAPKLSLYIEKMRENLAVALEVPLDCVSVKATTEERLGFTGAGEGIAAHAVSLLNAAQR